MEHPVSITEPSTHVKYLVIDLVAMTKPAGLVTATSRNSATTAPATIGKRVDASDLAELIAPLRPLSTRSVLATALLGAPTPRLPAAALVTAGSLFGISEGATRTCLWRMVNDGELTTDDASYALAGRLLERHARSRAVGVSDTIAWNGTWDVAVVSLDRRSATDRLELRTAAAALRLGELHEGVWTRPSNLDPTRLPDAQEIINRQCVRFTNARTEIDARTLGSMFALDTWADTCLRLTRTIAHALQTTVADHGSSSAFVSEFMLSIAAMRHLQTDPDLPAQLLPADWPAAHLGAGYADLEARVQADLSAAIKLNAS